jgi:hypothetical protein
MWANVADQFWLRRFDIVFPFLPPGSKTSSIRWPELQKSARFSGTKIKAGRRGRIWVAEAENRFLKG